jgi:macrolide-specific efflux system membrane fusion protein
MKKLVATIIVIGVLGIAVMAWRQADAKRREDKVRSAQAVRVTRRDIASAVKATGVIKPMIGAEVRVGSRASGVVRRLYVKVGDKVQKGQLLAELDVRELSARRAAAAAALERSQANLNYARAELGRKRALGNAQVIAVSELDLSQQAYAVAEQQHREAQANLEDASTQLGYARIFAPITGIVASVSTQEGETVAATFAAPTFVTLLDLSRLEVRTYVDETDIGRIRLGQKARFTVDTYGDYQFEGRVTAVYPQAEIRENVVNYVTVVKFTPPKDQILRPEMTTTVRIELARRENALVLPARAVRREGGRQFVLARHGDTIEQRWVNTGIRDEIYVEIIDGLHEGDEVLMGDTNEKK